MKQFILILFISLLFSSCSITKMRYNKGFNISFMERHSKDDQSDSKKFKSSNKTRTYATDENLHWKSSDSIFSDAIRANPFCEELPAIKDMTGPGLIKNPKQHSPLISFADTNISYVSTNPNPLTLFSTFFTILSAIGVFILITSALYSVIGFIFFFMNIPALVAATVAWAIDKKNKKKAIILISINLLALAIFSIIAIFLIEKGNDIIY